MGQNFCIYITNQIAYCKRLDNNGSNLAIPLSLVDTFHYNKCWRDKRDQKEILSCDTINQTKTTKDRTMHKL